MSITIATASYDRNIRFWEASTGRCIRQLNFADSQVNCMAISPDRKVLAAGGHNYIRIFDISPSNMSQGPILCTGEDGHSGNVTALGYIRTCGASSNSTGSVLFSTGEDGKLKFYDSKTLKRAREGDAKAPLTCAALAPNQALLYTGSAFGFVSVWDVAHPIPQGQKEVPDATPIEEVYAERDIAVRSIAVSPNGNYLCVANNAGRVHCFIITASTAPAEALAATAAALHPSAPSGGSLTPPAAANGSHQASIENLSVITATTDSEATGAPPDSPGARRHGAAGSAPTLVLAYSFQAHNKYILRCAISPNGRMLATASADYTINVWAIPPNLRGGSGDEKAQVAGEVARTASTVSSTHDDGPATPERKTSNLAQLKQSPGSTSSANATGAAQNASPGASAATVDAAAAPQKWELLKTMQGHQRWVWDCSFSLCSTYLVSVSSDHTGRLWSVDQNKLIVSYNGHTKPVTCVILDECPTRQESPSYK